MANGNFGEHLKRERDLREVTLAELTAGTRIGPRFLEAIENEDWDKLPGGSFTRGFVRSIAQYLGLDEEGLLSEYDLALGVQKTDARAPYQNQVPSPQTPLPRHIRPLPIPRLPLKHPTNSNSPSPPPCARMYASSPTIKRSSM